MELVGFSSALTQATQANGQQWLTTKHNNDIPFLLPDGTRLILSIELAGQPVKVSNSQPQRADIITVRASLQKKIDEANGTKPEAKDSRQPLYNLLPVEGFPLAFQCNPPKPKYKSPNDEPDDNSLATRAARYAFAKLDVSRVHHDWTALEAITYFWVQLYIIASLLPSEEAFNIAIPEGEEPNIVSEAVRGLLDANLAIPHPIPSALDGVTMLIAQRASFWQSPATFPRPPWLGHGWPNTVLSNSHVPASYIMSSSVHHPLRPRKPTAADGLLYSRYILELGQTLTFEAVSFQDTAFVQKFTEWHADDRVNTGWRQKGTFEEQKQYLQKIEASPDVLPLVGKWNGEPWGYVEVYWAKESSIGTYYGADDYDRGFHALVGENHLRGPHRVRAWMGSVIHMLFCLDARTQRVVLEPRASNAKMINYTSMCGGHVEKVSESAPSTPFIDFPSAH